MLVMNTCHPALAKSGRVISSRITLSLLFMLRYKCIVRMSQESVHFGAQTYSAPRECEIQFSA